MPIPLEDALTQVLEISLSTQNDGMVIGIILKEKENSDAVM